MLEALVSSLRSPDPNTQVGACIVNNKNRIIASGYNSYPNGIGLSTFSWERKHENPLKTKYPYVVHAENNAIHNAIGSLEGATLYVTLYPCSDCAKNIIQSGIKRIVYLDNPYKDTWQCKASKLMFTALDLVVEQHTWDTKTIKSCLVRLSEQITSNL
jgi:dCMP deaminase